VFSQLVPFSPIKAAHELYQLGDRENIRYGGSSHWRNSHSMLAASWMRVGSLAAVFMEKLNKLLSLHVRFSLREEIALHLGNTI
jgi:hypothetical protein